MVHLQVQEPIGCLLGLSNMKNLITILFLLTSLVGFSQISGTVIDQTGDTLPFVNIKAVDYDKGTTTDFDGKFTIDVPVGSKLVFSFISFRTDTLEATPNMNVTLHDRTLELGMVTITTDKIVGSEVGLVNEKKESDEVESSIGKKELTKKNISNAEDGVKKITGVTINNNKVNVRGLDDRYNQVTVNKFPIPSNNTDQKNIDLGLIPRSFIGSMKVRKTYTPNQWSNIGGAQIDINTNNIEKGLKIGYTGGYNFNNTDALNNRFNFSYGKKYNKFSYQIIGRYTLSNTYNEGFTKLIDKQGNIKLNYDVTNDLKRQDIFGSALLQYNHKNLRLKSVSMFVNSQKTLSTTTDGLHFDYTPDIYTTRVTPTNENLFLQQFIAEHEKGKLKTHVDVSYSLVSSGEDNRNQFVYLGEGGDYRFNNIDKLDNHHFYSQNLEHRYGSSVFMKYNTKKVNLEFGYNFMGTNNTFDYQQQYYNLYGLGSTTIDPNNPYDYINNDNHSLLDLSNPSSLVEGQTLIHGVYNVTKIKFKKVNITAGIRFENSYQGIFYRDQIQPSIERSEIVDSYEFLPSLSMKYKINKKNQLKVSTSRTTIRPRFRELTPFLYTEMFAGSKIQGNPELINSSVYNGDLSYEIYPSRGQVITFTGFGKYIINPIERVNVATASGRLETYQNGDMAYVVGGEIETKLKIKKFTVDYNLTVMYSQISLSDDGEVSTIVTNPQRELQGSTPILSNLDVFYTIDKHNVGVVYNYTGKKLFSAGIQGIGDVYQTNRHQLNLVYKYKKDKLSLQAGINNILNSPFELTQGSDDGVKDVNYFTTGVGVSVGVNYSF